MVKNEGESRLSCAVINAVTKIPQFYDCDDVDLVKDSHLEDSIIEQKMINCVVNVANGKLKQRKEVPMKKQTGAKTEL